MRFEARLVVVDDRGRCVGAIGPFPCGPHPQECATLLDAARDAGVAVSVLRLAAQTTHADTVERTYVVEALHPVREGTLGPASFPDELQGVPLRLDYARVGGVLDDVRWAAAALRRLGRTMRGWPEQMRTWNLSCVHRIALTDGSHAWLKVVPPFFRHEGAMLRFMAHADCGVSVPAVLAHDDDHHRLLLDDVPGELMWSAPLEAWLKVVERHVVAQFSLRDRVPYLCSIGVADWRRSAFCEAVRRLLARPEVHRTLAVQTRGRLARLVSVMDSSMERIAGCGLPESLVHGDLHRGNVIASPDGAQVVLDWGDAGVGHPLFDVPAMCHGWSAAEAAQIRACVVRTWGELIPGADPAGALDAIAPFAAVRQALVYQGFLDGIEADERHYHEADVPARLTAAVR